MKSPFVAIGTGRCGTVSLSKILSACRFVCCNHEKYVTKWYEPKIIILQRLVNYLRQSFSSEFLYGEVQPHLLPHLDFVREKIPELKIICLHRPCEEVVASFMRRGPDKLRPSVRKHQKNTKWVERLPDIEAYTAEDAVRYYWDMYEKAMADMSGAFHLQMQELNSDDKLTELFDFLDIPELHRVYLSNRCYNAS